MRVSKWGNSLAIRIPRDVAEALGLKEGDDVALVPGEARALRLDRQLRREEALEGIKELRRPLPEGWKFDRDEANAR
jgi:antitoxin MazE